MTLQRGQPLFERIADRLRVEIRAGRYRPGDKLPSGSELAETFGVSIVTARQAIAQLRAEGLVRSRVGSGVYVTAGGPPRRMSEDILRGEAF